MHSIKGKGLNGEAVWEKRGSFGFRCNIQQVFGRLGSSSELALRSDSDSLDPP